VLFRSSLSTCQPEGTDYESLTVDFLAMATLDNTDN
jgi:hypothetical protein